MYGEIYQENKYRFTGRKLKKRNEVIKMTIKSGLSAKTPERIFVDAGAVYLNYGLSGEELLGATRGGNEFNLNRVIRDIEVDGVKGSTKGLRRVTEVRPQITCNLIELSLDNLLKAIAGANQVGSTKQLVIDSEYVGPGTGAQVIFGLDHPPVVEDTEKVYIDGVLQSRSAKYGSRFVGVNAANNKSFETNLGDWTKGHDDDAIELVTGGKLGNCLHYTGSAASVAGFLTLSGGSGARLTNLVVGEHYKLRIAVSILADAFIPTFTIKCTGNPESDAIDPGASWVVHVLEFTATGTDASIILTATPAPVVGDDLYIDYLELERVDGEYVMNWDKGEVIFAVAPAGGGTPEEVTIGYTYETIPPFVPTAYADSTEHPGVNTKITYATHGMLDGDTIIISGTTAGEYDGTWVIEHVTDNTFDIVKVYGTNPVAKGTVYLQGLHDIITGADIGDTDYIDNVALVGTISGKGNDVICIVKNALADTGFSLATAPRDEAVPVIVFTGHYDPAYPDTEPWEIHYPRA